MKKSIVSSFLCVALVALIVSPSLGQTVAEVLEKIVETQGGPEFLKSVKDMTVTGSIDLVQQGMSGSLTIYKKEPDKRRTDIEVMGMLITQAYDGKTAWWVNPQTGSTEELSGQQAEDLKRQSLALVASLDPAKYGLSYKLKNKETVEGKNYLVLEETFPDGLKANLYIDPETYLTHRAKLKVMGPAGTEVDVEQIMSDFRKEGDMMMAHSIITYQSGAEYTKISLKEIKFNTGLEDSLFKMAQ
jgi:outer membrane lipoprotein-sorting protein